MGVHKVKRRAVFLDRDGTLIPQRDEITKASQVRPLKNAAAGVALLNGLGFMTIVITNQPIIGRGLITKREAGRLNKIMAAHFLQRRAKLNAFYICPHQYEDHCPCRKPKLLLVRRAVKRYNIDIKKSFFIGDTLRDMETGRRAKMKTIFVKTGGSKTDDAFFKKTKPDFVARDLLAAARTVKRLSK